MRSGVATATATIPIRGRAERRTAPPAEWATGHRVALARQADISPSSKEADTHGASVGIYARRLLEVDLPWTRMRQVYRLLGYARRYGDQRTDIACAQALALDVVDVGLIGRILERGREHARLPDPPVAQRLPLRFARHQEPVR